MLPAIVRTVRRRRCPPTRSNRLCRRLPRSPIRSKQGGRGGSNKRPATLVLTAAPLQSVRSGRAHWPDTARPASDRIQDTAHLQDALGVPAASRSLRSGFPHGEHPMQYVNATLTWRACGAGPRRPRDCRRRVLSARRIATFDSLQGRKSVNLPREIARFLTAFERELDVAEAARPDGRRDRSCGGNWPGDCHGAGAPRLPSGARRY